MSHTLYCLITALMVFITALCVGQAEIESANPEVHARRAVDFVDSMGINVHLENNTTRPYKNYQLINEALRSLGMRHVRDEINHADPLSPAYDPSFVAELLQVGSLGYSLCGLIEGGDDYPPRGTTLDASHVIPMMASLRPTIDVLEGLNEPDDRIRPPFTYGVDNARYPLGAVHESEDLWNIVRNSSRIMNLPVLGMSEGAATDFRKLAKLQGVPPPSTYTTYGNMHAYQGGGVGDNGLDGYIRLSQVWTGREPLWTTEMGYHNNTNYLSDGEQQGVSPRASAIYLPIAFLSGFNHNVVRTFSYELIDEASGPPPAKCSKAGQSKCSGEGHYGLLHYDFTPKPAFTALKNLIELLHDDGANFNPGTLTVAFTDAPPTMRYTLLQKSNGDYFLALWNDISVYDMATPTTPGKNRYPDNVPITLTFANPQTFSVYAPNDATGVSPTDKYTISASPSALQVELPPEVLLIRIVADR